MNLYLHIPFCASKCAYCNFYSIINSPHLVEPYLTALNQELNLVSNVSTIYIGGGTPSLLTEAQISSLKFPKTQEFTLEANPESVTKKKLETYLKLGINRLSLGLQAWQDRLLTTMKRPHNCSDFLKTFQLARNLGFNNINIDLIFGYPTQTFSDWNESLTEIINLQPEHISCYSLENYRHLAKVDELLDRQMYYLAKDMLTSAGYVHYEISNFAKPGFECRHNLDFWHHQQYLGIGAGAHGFINNTHYHHDLLPHYLRDPHCQLVDLVLDQTSEKLEWLILRLRLVQGFPLLDYERQFHTELLHDFDMNKLIDNQLIELKSDQLKLTSRGLDLCDHVINCLCACTP